jgi:hypothetical protein
VDDNYSKKLDNVLKNLKFIAMDHEGQEVENFKEFCDKLLAKKQVKLIVLIKSNPQFKDLANDIQSKINEKRKLQMARTASADAKAAKPKDIKTYVENITQGQDEEMKELPKKE